MCTENGPRRQQEASALFCRLDVCRPKSAASYAQFVKVIGNCGPCRACDRPCGGQGSRYAPTTRRLFSVAPPWEYTVDLCSRRWIGCALIGLVLLSATLAYFSWYRLQPGTSAGATETTSLSSNTMRSGNERAVAAALSHLRALGALPAEGSREIRVDELHGMWAVGVYSRPYSPGSFCTVLVTKSGEVVRVNPGQ